METDLDFFTRIEFKEELGKGAFGTVHRVIFKQPYKGYTEAAAKHVQRPRREEVDILGKLNHPNIVKFIALFCSGPVNIILLEYSHIGSLYNYLTDHAMPLTNSLQRQWANEAAIAIEYLHKSKCLHRDIKPSNCLLFEDKTLKLCDFGLAREIARAYILSSEKGTYQYMAPEIINTNDNNQANFSIFTDIYAYGMLLLAIYTRQTPFHGMDYAYVVYHVALGKLQPDVPGNVPPKVKDVMGKCWHVQPIRRPTIDSILEVLDMEGAVPKRGHRCAIGETSAFHSISTTIAPEQNQKTDMMDEDASNSNPDSYAPAPEPVSGNSTTGMCYTLPEHHELQLKVFYRDKLMIDKLIHSPKGCIVYYNKIKEGIDVSAVETISLPLLGFAPGLTSIDHIKYTNTKVVKFTENGVHLFADESGIYAVRHCRSKVFFWSTDRHEEMVVTEVLPRDQKHIIFDYERFKEKLRDYLKAKKENAPILWYPAVVLTFAQKWSIGYPLNSVLVSAILEPMRSKAMLDDLFAGYDVKPKIKSVHRQLRSYDSSVFEVDVE